MLLQDLSDELLCALWPVERVLAGVVVSQKLHCVLQCAHHVRFLVNPRSMLRFQQQQSQGFAVSDEEVVRRIGDALCCFRNAGNVTFDFTDHEQCSLLADIELILESYDVQGTNQARMFLAAVAKAAVQCTNISEITLRGLPEDLMSHCLTVDGNLSDAMASLQQLELSSCYTSLGRSHPGGVFSIMKCSSLTELTLAKLDLDVNSLQALAHVLGSCSGLQSLVLRETVLPCYIPLPTNSRERYRTARNTFWQAIMEGTIISLTDLTLSGLDLRSCDHVLWDSLSRLTSLKYVDFSDLEPLDQDRFWPSMLSGLPKTASLTHLNLSNNFCSGPEALAIAQAVPSWPALRFLSLCSSRIQDANAVSVLLSALGSCCPLMADLNVFGCSMDRFDKALSTIHRQEFSSFFLSAELSNWPQLTSLDISYCIRLGQDKQFAKTLGQCTRLRILKVTVAIPDLAAHCTALTHLSLSGTALAESGDPELFASLSSLTELRTIEICNTRTSLSSNLAENFKRFLPQLPQLCKLDLSRSAIGPKGATALADVLARCSALEHLLLEQTDIQTEGAKHLACRLLEMKRLTHLVLSHCNMGDEGTLAICSAIPSQLSHLNVSYNEIGSTSYEKLSQVLPECPYLTTVDLQVEGPEQETWSARAGLAAALEAAGRLHLLRVNGFTGSCGDEWNTELEAQWAEEIEMAEAEEEAEEAEEAEEEADAEDEVNSEAWDSVEEDAEEEEVDAEDEVNSEDWDSEEEW